MSDYEEFECRQGKYIEIFGEDNLFSRIFMSRDEVLQIFKNSVKKRLR